MATTTATQTACMKKLSCQTCKQRKKKCDKRSTCSLCMKLGIPCLPTTPAPPRRRRQRAREMIARLERFEQLLRQLAIPPVPSVERDSPDSAASTATTTNIGERSSSSLEPRGGYSDHQIQHFISESRRQYCNKIISSDFELRPRPSSGHTKTGSEGYRTSSMGPNGPSPGLGTG